MAQMTEQCSMNSGDLLCNLRTLRILVLKSEAVEDLSRAKDALNAQAALDNLETK